MEVCKVAVACVMLALCSSVQVKGQAAGCAPCDPDACAPAPSLCAAGLVTDACGCCMLCGKTEGQRCDHPDLPAPPAGEEAGKCGEHLECRLRDDVLPGATPEAVCQCRLEGVVCGSDGTSYDNACHLLEQAIVSQMKITVKSMGPCQSGQSWSYFKARYLFSFLFILNIYSICILAVSQFPASHP